MCSIFRSYICLSSGLQVLMNWKLLASAWNTQDVILSKFSSASFLSSPVSSLCWSYSSAKCKNILKVSLKTSGYFSKGKAVSKLAFARRATSGLESKNEQYQIGKIFLMCGPSLRLAFVMKPEKLSCAASLTSLSRSFSKTRHIWKRKKVRIFGISSDSGSIAETNAFNS